MSVFQTASQDIQANTLIPFDFEENPVRVTLDEHGAPWFHAGDICRILGHGNPRQVVESHVDPEDVQKCDTLTAGGVQQANYVNESGLYALIFGSTKPEAKRFKRWVTGDVLPAIRKTGGYGTDQTLLEGMARMAEQLQRISEELQQPSTAIPPMPRSELKAKYDRYGYMAYHQAVQPIHLEHGQAWTTTLAMSYACDLNHMVFVDKLQKLTRDHTLLPSEYCCLYINPSSSGIGVIHGFQLSETGFQKVVAFLETLDLDEKALAAVHKGAEKLTEAFRAVGRKSFFARSNSEKSKFASAMADVAETISKLASTLGNKGGHRHGQE
ncbi:MAG: hypothetical protein HQL74_08160 [Magnetococcales bacterium]|nr:hypothetical protein [Magnetococcales bacterium]